MYAIIRTTLLACVLLATSNLGGATLARGAEQDRVAAGPFELYCAGCHALGDGVGRDGVPNLSDLVTKYGTPLPRARLLEFVTSDHRPGGPRICGERVFGKLPATRFLVHVERAQVRDALAFVEAAQRAQ